MNTYVYETKEEMGAAAAAQGAKRIIEAIGNNGECRLILATGASQFEVLDALVADERIDWGKVTCFHLDEYIGLGIEHKASFRKYLKERFVDRVADLKKFHYVNGDAEDPEAECERLGKLIHEGAIDVAFIGIGENGHIAFNDPPADFLTEKAYITVTLDDACRNQQFGEGWFASFNDVPTHAISMSVNQIMKSRCIICSVPDERKANAVQDCMSLPVSNLHPATILQMHPDCYLYLDEAAAGVEVYE